MSEYTIRFKNPLARVFGSVDGTFVTSDDGTKFDVTVESSEDFLGHPISPSKWNRVEDAVAAWRKSQADDHKATPRAWPGVPQPKTAMQRRFELAFIEWLQATTGLDLSDEIDGWAVDATSLYAGAAYVTGRIQIMHPRYGRVLTEVMQVIIDDWCVHSTAFPSRPVHPFWAFPQKGEQVGFASAIEALVYLFDVYRQPPF